MITIKEEDEIIKWLFGEIVYYKNYYRDVLLKDQQWLSHTRLEKIMFMICEKYDIPITRSWYQWGGYIHSNLLESSYFENYRKKYAEKHEIVEKMRSDIMKLGIDVELLLNDLHPIIDKVLLVSSKIFLPKYYSEEAPKEYREIYISKQLLADNFNEIIDKKSINDKDVISYNNNYLENFINFKYNSLNIINDKILNNTVLEFNDIVESTFEKFQYSLLNEDYSIFSKLSFFTSIYNFYKDYIWAPFACKISQNTVKGIRRDQERRNMAEKETNSIHFGAENILDLSVKRHRLKLQLDFNEYSNFYKDNTKNELNNILAELLKIYHRSDDEIE